MARKKIEIPESLSKLVQFNLHPDIHREIKIGMLRDDFDSVSEWLHEHLCRTLEREDLSLRSAATARSR